MLKKITLTISLLLIGVAALSLEVFMLSNLHLLHLRITIAMWTIILLILEITALNKIWRIE